MSTNDAENEPPANTNEAVARESMATNAAENEPPANTNEAEDARTVSGAPKLTGNRKLLEYLTTEYMAMSKWAWTPAKWFTSTHPPPKPASKGEYPSSEDLAGTPRNVPLQLQRLPKSHLASVRDALGLLQQIEVHEIPSVDGLMSNLGAASSRRATQELVDGFTSEYMDMCEWAWRPSAWRIGRQINAPIICKLADMSDLGMRQAKESLDTWQTTQRKEMTEKLPVDEKLAKRLAHCRKRCPQESWLAAMVSAGEELRLWGEMDWMPKSYGNGAVPLFSKGPGKLASDEPAASASNQSNANSADQSAGSSQEAKPKPPNPRADLPVAMRKMPRSRLQGMNNVLQSLGSTGLGEVPDVGDLFGKLSATIPPSPEPDLCDEPDIVDRTDTRWMLQRLADPSVDWFDRNFGLLSEVQRPRTRGFGRDTFFSGHGDATKRFEGMRFIKSVFRSNGVPATELPKTKVRGGPRYPAKEKLEEARLRKSEGDTHWNRLGAGAKVPSQIHSQSVLTLHFGSFGCGVGMEAWKNLFNDHGLGLDGRPKAEVVGKADVHFYEAKSGRFVPRTVFADADPAGLATASSSNCFAPADLVSGSGSFNYNWAEGRGLAGTTASLRKQWGERFRQQLEQVDSLSCILMSHAAAGGTGGGFATNCMELIRDQLGKKRLLWSLCIVPPPAQEVEGNEAGNVAPGPGSGWAHVNTMLTMNSLREDADGVLLFDAIGLRDLALSMNISPSPSEADNHTLVGRVVPMVSSSMRLACQGPGNGSIEGIRPAMPREMLNALQPYPRIKYILPSYAPLGPADGDDFAPNKANATQQCLTGNAMHSIDLAKGSLVSMAMCCRSENPLQAARVVADYNTTYKPKITDYTPSSVFIGSHWEADATAETQVLCLRNHTAVGNYFSSWGQTVDELGGGNIDAMEIVQEYAKSGMDRDMVVEAREQLASLEKDYEEIAIETACEEEEGEE
eukprot:TRINITY_DN16784_c1_g1_i1.p1 TRINITY_DN16784_c1_g1~~TRINITY_DN16784_c1_g1_i1.p1  ORF type:complete len:962 (-),score=160.63 TRINITY_DN16784_c1_g1_i1:25-2910(-)